MTSSWRLQQAVDEQFPFIDMEELQDNEKLKIRLELESEKIGQEFSSLVVCTTASLRKQNIPVQDMIILIKNWPNKNESNNNLIKTLRSTDNGDVPTGTDTGDVSTCTDTGDISKGTDTGDVPTGTDTGDVPTGTDTGGVSKGTDTGDVPTGTNTGDVSTGTDNGDVPRDTDTGDVPRGTDTGDVSTGTDTGDVSKGTDTGDVPTGTDTGDVPTGTATGDIPKGTDIGDVPTGTDTGDFPTGTDTGDASKRTDTGDVPTGTDTCDIPTGTDTGGVPTGTDSGDIPTGTDTGDVSTDTDTGDVPTGTDTGNVPTGTDTGDIPTGTDTGDVSKGTDTRDLPTGTDTGGVPTGTDTGDIPTGTDTGDVPTGTDTGDIPTGTDTGGIPSSLHPAVTAVNLTPDVTDFETFENILRKTLEKGRLDGESEESKKRISVITTMAIRSLRSHYKQTYDDILITVLVHPFQSGNSENIITLHPMSLDNLETILKLFYEQRAEFNKYYLKEKYLHLQAYLFYLAVYLCDEQSNFEQLKERMVQMMRSLSPPLHQDVEQCINQQDSSLSVLKGNLWHLLTKRPHRQALIKKSNQNCSFNEILRVEVAVYDDHVPSALLKNQVVSNLLEKLGMTAFYHKKLCLKDALCIRQEPLILSLDNITPTDLKQLPHLVLHKLMAYDLNWRSKSVPELKTVADDDYEYNDESESNSDGVHPIDVILALFHCSDDFLRQDLLSRLAKCQMSVPFILPDPFTEQLTIPLWALRSIIKNWKTIKADKIEPQEHSIVQYPMPIVSFIGFGKQKQGKSKSIILNEVISEFHCHFFHRDCPGGHNDCLLGQGLVDMSWYLPAGKVSDIFPDAVTFLNLHGDARQYPLQSRFLGQISSMCFVLLTEEVRTSDSETIKILKMFSKCPGGITLLDTIGKKPEIIIKEVSGVHPIKLTNKNASDIKHSVREQIKKKLKDLDKLQNLETCCLKKENILIDEDSDAFREIFALTNEVKNIVASNTIINKNTLLPLQGQDLFQAWAENDREFYRQSHRGATLINKYTAEITTRKEELRSKQLGKVDSLSPVMKSFLTSLLTLEGHLNFKQRNYFLQSLKLELDTISRKGITDLQYQYQNTKQELAKLQDKTTSQTDVKVKIEACKEKMRSLQDSIINNSVGLEHFFRELGQIYEAAIESPIYKKENSLSRLPKAAAELLIDGYPLEVMDGDAAHVPLKWFTAVLKEAVEILGNPKVFIMSVLGLQSTGKSTMLNTAFGLQFNVSAGRCTRGAFIQLLPLDEELKETTKCSYVLVVDTEGLRAPELDPLKTLKHDNKLATFVIGLANMTLINIYGEVPGDMDDILQTSVHAFLRMSEVKCHPSCQFVHQNAGSNIKSQVGRSMFTEKLNKLTIDAAREERCEGQYETFNDVIKFDSEKDVHHFQCLWKGDPPMAPVNEGYSYCAQKLKLSCIKVLQEQNFDDFDLCSFHERVSSLWQSLLKENFVFSFKNTLEIAVYNSLEAEYHKWKWEFHEGMLEWEQALHNEIKATKDLQVVHDLMERKRENMRKEVIPKFYESIKYKMDTFFKGKQADILVQWKARFDQKLTDLKSELEERAEKRCINLRESKDAISRIQNDQAKYTAIITAKVKEHIATLKRDQKKLSQNLKKGQLEPSQLKDILKREPFTDRKVELYKIKKIITPKQADYINMVLGGNKLTERHLCTIMCDGVIELKRVKNILKENPQPKEELKANFEKIWNEIVNDIDFVRIKAINVEREVEDMLVAFLYDRKGKLIDLVRKKNLSERSDLHLEVEEGRHYKVKDSIIVTAAYKLFDGIIVEKPHYHIQAVELTNRVLTVARDYLKKKDEDSDSDFNTAFTQELLHKLEKKIRDETKCEQIKTHLKFTPEYRLDVYLTACGYAIPKFKDMNEKFRKQHDPQLYLKKYVKGPLYVLYENQCYQAEAEDAIANTICSHLEEPIKTQVREVIGVKMVSMMKANDPLFSSKMSLKVKILSDLLNEDDFSMYMEYLLDVKKSIFKWLRSYTIKYCEEELCDTKRLETVLKNEVKELTLFVESKLDELPQSEVQEWVKVFSEDSSLKQKLGVSLQAEDILAGYETYKMNMDNFKQHIRSGLKTLREEIKSSFDGVHSENEMKNWRNNPLDLVFKDVVGCTEQCPFCGEQCDLGENHFPGRCHYTKIHRPSCLATFRYTKTQVLSTDFCPANVYDKARKFRTSRTDWKEHPFSDYASVYPDWSIDPDPSSSESLYWKWFTGKYMAELAEVFNAEPATDLEKWATTSKEEIRENLKSLYNY